MGEFPFDRRLAVKAAWTRPAGGLIAAALIAALVFAAFRLLPPLVAAENRARDLVHALVYPPLPPREDIALVLIDEATLATLPYRSPIDRGFLAALVARLRALGARAIGVDLLIDQATEEAKDFAFLDVIEAAGAPVVMVTADQEDGLTDPQAEMLSAMTELVAVGQAALLRDPVDFVTRAAPAARMVAGRKAPSFAAAMAAAGGAAAPEDGFEIAFARATEGDFIERYTAAAWAGFEAQSFKDRYVFIGVDLAGIDRHRTPLQAITNEADRPGVESHAQALAQILDNRRLVEAPPLWEGLGALLAALLAVGALFLPVRVLARLAVALLVVGVFAAAPAVAMAGGAIRAPVLAPIFSAIAAGIVVALARWRAEAATRRRLRDAFGRYVSPAVVREIEQAPEALSLGGEAREITCVFTDVAGFTGLCEGLAPDALVTLLNRYLGGASAIVVDHGGTIDKFVGDAIVSFFGAPLTRADHAAAAIRMAVALDRFAEAFIAEIEAEGGRFGVTRIGVHTGRATVGNFGGDVFFDYTAMGDTMNVAARLEGANKAYGGRLTISGDALAHAGGAVAGVLTRPIGRLIVKGRVEPMATHEAFAPDDPRAAAQSAYLAAYEQLASEGSAEGFLRLADAHPDDRLIAFHAARAQAGERGDIVTLKEK